MRRVRSLEELDAIRKDGRGYVYNDFTKAGATAGKDNVLHRASCSELAKMTLSVRKFFVDPDEDAASWLQDNRGPEGLRWRRCGVCGGGSGRRPVDTESVHGGSRAGSPYLKVAVPGEGALPERVSHEAAAITALADQLGELPGITVSSGQGRENRLAAPGLDPERGRSWQFGDVRFESPHATVVVEFESAGGVTNLAKYWPHLLSKQSPKRFVLAHVFRIQTERDYITHRRLWEFLVERMRTDLAAEANLGFPDDWEARSFTYPANEIDLAELGAFVRGALAPDS